MILVQSNQSKLIKSFRKIISEGRNRPPGLNIGIRFGENIPVSEAADSCRLYASETLYVKCDM